MTVTVDQSLPVGVLTLRSFKMRAIARAGSPSSSAKIEDHQCSLRPINCAFFVRPQSGYVDGENVAIDYRSGDNERDAALTHRCSVLA